MVKAIILRLLYRTVRPMISIRFFLLILCISLTISVIWIQVIENNKIASNESLIEEALENGARDYRFAEVYRKTDKLPKSMKYVLLWTPKEFAPFYYFDIGQRGFIENKCSEINCFVTTDRNFFDGDVTKFDVIAFNGRNLFTRSSDLPDNRSVHQKYIYFNLESADNYPICTTAFDNFYNWTGTYRLDSDLPFPYIQIRNQYDEVVGPKPNMDWPVNIYEDDDYDYRQNKSKAVAWFVSHCSSRSGRKTYAKQLQKALAPFGWTVDIYGACGPFKCPRSLKNNCDNILDRDYFFYLSFENSFSDDYVTEKLLTALQRNIVPIVFGGADYNRFLPPGSYIDARKTTPQELALYINEIIVSPSLYNSFFKWKPFYKYRDPSMTDCVCAMCAALNNETLFQGYSSYEDFRRWWNPRYKERCRT